MLTEPEKHLDEVLLRKDNISSPWEMMKTESDSKRLNPATNAAIEDSIHDIKIMIEDIEDIIFKQQISKVSSLF